MTNATPWHKKGWRGIKKILHTNTYTITTSDQKRKETMKRRSKKVNEVQPYQEEIEQFSLELLATWSEEAYPGDDLINDCNCGREECTSVAKYFTKRSWQEVRFPDVLKGCGPGWDTPIHYLTPSAFRYFLPSFMLLFIHHHLSLDVLATHIIRSLCPHEGWRRKVELLHPPQQQVVLHFLQNIKRWFPMFVQHGHTAMIEKGIPFWDEQLKRQNQTTS